MNFQLYRHFDADGRLLYIGKSISAVMRLSGHRSASSWYGEISRVEIENFESVADLSAAEVVAIRQEQPIYNIVHNKPPRSEMRSVTVWVWPEMHALLKASAAKHGVTISQIIAEGVAMALEGKYKP